MEQRSVIDDWDRFRTLWTLLRGAGRHEFTPNLYSAREPKDMIHRAGFARTKAFGSLDTTPYDHNAWRLITIADRS